MTELIHKTGDIFTTTAKGIGHGCNTVGVMGSGIAVLFRDRFPKMHEEYKRRCHDGELLPGGLYPYQFMSHPKLFVYNIASQHQPGANATYEYLISGVQRALKHAESEGLDRIALPRIGSGVGGLQENFVEGVLLTLATLSPVDIELWTLPEHTKGA